MIVDASVFIAAAIGQEPDHKIALAFIELLASKADLTLDLPEITFVEVACGLGRRSGKPLESFQYAKSIELFEPLRIYTIDASLRQLAMHIGTYYRLRAADALYIALAQMAHTPLISLDTEQLTRAPRTVQVVSPKEALDLV